MLYYGRHTGKTKLGNRFVVLQDAPDSYHITVQRGDLLVAETVYELADEAHMTSVIEELEKELYPPLLTSGA